MTTVLVADDQALIRQAITGLLSRASGIDVVGQAHDGEDALRQAQRLMPEVVLMDIRMPRMDGIAATSAIRATPELARTRVLILTTFEEDQLLFAALRAGASGFVGKGAEPADIVRAVETVGDGHSLLSPAATQHLIARFVQSPPATESRDSRALRTILTQREIEVLRLVGTGLSNQRIALSLGISPHTAKTHVNRVMQKLGAHERAQLVIAAYESHLVSPRTARPTD